MKDKKGLLLAISLLGILTFLGSVTYLQADCFDFNDGTIQNWTIDQIYETDTQTKKTPAKGFVLDNDQNQLAATADPLLIGGGTSGTYSHDIYLESPDLSSVSAWQNISGYSIDILRTLTGQCGDPGPNVFFAQLQLRVIDTSDNSTHLFAENDGSNFVFHTIDLSTPYHFVWKPSFLSDAKYKVKKVRIRLLGAHDYWSGECAAKGSWIIDNVCAETSTPPSESLILTSPNGAENWQVGTQHNITWTSQNFSDPVKIEYSIDHGSNYTTIVPSTPNNGSYEWTIPNNISVWCLIRISDASDENPADESDNFFTISDPTQWLTVISPNGGEIWQVGTQYEIKWSSSGFSNAVSIDFTSTENHMHYSIVSSTANDGSFDWTIPGLLTPPIDGKIRIADASMDIPMDLSDANFTIVQAGADNTQPGTNVNVNLGSGSTITFDNVTTAGYTSMTTSNTGSPPPNGFTIIPSSNPTHYEITTTATFTGNIKICIQYDDTGLTATQEAALKLKVYENSQWVDITISLDTNANIICGEVNHLSEFAIMLPSSNSIVKFIPLISNLRIGHPDTIDVVIDNVADLGSFEFDISYDGSIVQIAQSSDVILGDFVSSTGRSAIPVGPTIDNSAGSIVYGAASLGTQAGASGSGVLARIIWTPQSEGTTTLDLRNIKVSDTQGIQIPVTDQDGQINVTSHFWADIDGDNDIDIIDVQLVAAHWNTQNGDANYDPVCDVDNNGQGDGDVDIIDVQLVASWWNKSIPPNSQLRFYNEQENNLGKKSEQQNMSLRIIAENPETSGKGSLIIQVENAFDLAGFQFDLALNKNHTPMPEIILGDFLAGSSNKISALGPRRNNSGNKLTYGAFSMGKNKGTTGTGVLARIQLEKGMDFANGLIFENFMLVDSRGQQLKISAVNNEYANLMEQAQLPNNFSLLQNYPNPFNPDTYISFELPDGQKGQNHVGLFIYNMQGQLVRQLINENKSPGAYTIKWNAKNDLGEKVPSGIYVYALTVGDFKTSRKMLFLK